MIFDSSLNGRSTERAAAADVENRHSRHVVRPSTRYISQQPTNETNAHKSHLSGIDRLWCLYLWTVKHTEDEYRTVKELLADPVNFVFRIQMLLLCVARFADLPHEAVVQASFRPLVVIT